MDHAHHVFSPCLHHAAARFSGVSTCLASARIIHVKPHPEPDMQIARIRLSDKISRLHPRHVVPKPRQAPGIHWARCPKPRGLGVELRRHLNVDCNE
jgi:hypothetical protein